MNELIPLKNYLQDGVRASLGIFERRGYFPRPPSLPNASVPYAATFLTVHLAELFLRLLVSFAIGVLIWMLTGASLIWFRWFLFFLMGCGHVVDVGRTFTYFRLQPNPTSPPLQPRPLPHSDLIVAEREPVLGSEVAKGEIPAGEGLPENKSEPVSSTPVAESSSTPSDTGRLLETGKPEEDQVGASSDSGQYEEGAIIESQAPKLLVDSGSGETAKPPAVAEFESFSEGEPIDTVESLTEKAVVIPNLKIASIPREGGALVKFQGVLVNLFSAEAFT